MTPNQLRNRLLLEDCDADEIDDRVDELAEQMNNDARDREIETGELK